MIGLKIEVKNLDRLRDNFTKSPATVLHYLGAAVKASILEVEKQAVDRNFQFKMPRGMRTGYLQRSFAFGRYFHPSGLMASIGPTAVYSPYVYFGTRRGVQPNKYMDRIAKAAEPEVNKHFNQAVENVVAKLAS